MSDQIDETKNEVRDVADAVSTPVETAKELATEADRGTSDRTPAIALTGVTMIVAVLVGVVLLIAFLAYVIA